MRTLLAVLIITALAPLAAPAAQPNIPLSVYQIEPARDWAILGAATVLDLYPGLSGYHFIHIRSEVNPDSLNSLDRSVIGNRNIFADNMSDAVVVTSVAAPALLDYLDVGWNRVFYEDMMVYAQTLTINSAITELFKYTTQRPIPRVYAGDPSVTGHHRGYEEFYSGHVATSTAALSAMALTLDLRHDAGFWPWLAPIVVGTGVALARVAAGEHFYTGVIMGGVMGPAVGVLVPWLHKRQLEGKPTISLAPVEGGAGLTWSQRF